MGAALKTPTRDMPSSAWKSLPARMRVLHITNRQRTGGWLAEAFAGDSASEIILEEVVGSTAGLSRLRDEAFDAVLVSHEPGELDALGLIEGYRAGGSGEPIVVMGIQSEQEMAALCYEVGADAYVCANTTTTRNLIWIVARAVQRHQLICENRRLNQADRQRLQREHEEARRLLWQQRALIGDLQAMHHPAGVKRPEPAAQDWLAGTDGATDQISHGPPSSLPTELVDHYRELLRTYVIMGSGNLAGELSDLAELLVAARVTASQAMQLHLHVLTELVHGLGSRSTRHVMTRADLLVIEIMIHLAEGYYQRYLERANPPTQRTLPGFEEQRSAAA